MFSLILKYLKFYHARNLGSGLMKQYYLVIEDLGGDIKFAEEICPSIIHYRTKSVELVQRAIQLKREIRRDGMFD